MMTASWRDVEMAYSQGTLNFRMGYQGADFNLPRDVKSTLQNMGQPNVDDVAYIIAWAVLIVSAILFAVGAYKYTDAKDDEWEAEQLSTPVLVHNEDSVSA